MYPSWHVSDNRLEPGAFMSNEELSVRDSGTAGISCRGMASVVHCHEQVISPETGRLRPANRTDDGQRCAFFGMEYPAADNVSSTDGKGIHVGCGQERGEDCRKGVARE